MKIYGLLIRLFEDNQKGLKIIGNNKLIDKFDNIIRDLQSKTDYRIRPEQEITDTLLAEINKDPANTEGHVYAKGYQELLKIKKAYKSDKELRVSIQNAIHRYVRLVNVPYLIDAGIKVTKELERIDSGTISLNRKRSSQKFFASKEKEGNLNVDPGFHQGLYN